MSYSTDELKRAKAKIEKCLAMAKSSSPKEAETAKRQAEALLRKYGMIRTPQGNVYYATPPTPVKAQTLTEIIVEKVVQLGLNQKRKAVQQSVLKCYQAVEQKTKEIPYDDLAKEAINKTKKVKEFIKQIHFY